MGCSGEAEPVTIDLGHRANCDFEKRGTVQTTTAASGNDVEQTGVGERTMQIPQQITGSRNGRSMELGSYRVVISGIASKRLVWRTHLGEFQRF